MVTTMPQSRWFVGAYLYLELVLLFCNYVCIVLCLYYICVYIITDVLLAQPLAHHDSAGPLCADGFPCEFATWYEFTGIVSTQYNGITMDAYLQQDHHGIFSNPNGILSAMESR